MTERHPAMSIVIYTPDTYATIRRTLEYLQRQSVRHTLEIVIAAPDAKHVQPDSLCRDFCGVQIISVGSEVTLGTARAQAIGCAHAPIVALVEDHSFMNPGWAAALIRAHEQPYAVVGPAITNPNPATAVSWADFLMNYAPWIAPVPAGEAEHLPGHNSSYKRDLLLQYGELLPGYLGAETAMHWDLHGKGHKLYLEPAAETAHVNYSLAAPFIPLQFLAGRLFASIRAREWPLSKRIMYAMGSPLIPVVRLRRIWHDARRSSAARQAWLRVLPMLLLGLVASGLGEGVGYLFGAGDIEARLNFMEVRRFDYITPAERKTLFEDPL